MVRLKALWISGKIGSQWHDLEGVIREASRQARRVLGCKNVYVVELLPSRVSEGYIALVAKGGSMPLVVEGEKEMSNE